MVEQLRKVCQDHPGKIPEAMLLAPSCHHDFIMVDILPDVRVTAFTNQRQTHNITKITLGVLVAVDMTTKYSQFVLISYKAEPDLVEALT